MTENNRFLSNNPKKRTAFAGGQISGGNQWLDTGLGKVPPQSLDMEEAVLGAIMVEKDALTQVIDSLKPDSFYKDAHQRIYRAILALFANSDPVDLLTVKAQLSKNGELDMAGGALYLAQLTERVSSAANIIYHASIVIQNSIKRELIRISSEIGREAFEDTSDAFELLDKANQAIYAATDQGVKKSYQDMGLLMRTALVELEEKMNNKSGLTGIPSGFSNLDRVTSGWQKTELVIIAARPGMGKCLGKGTKIVMFDGTLKKVEEIQVGELLMGDDSTPRNVLSLARGRENMYWVRQNKGIDYRVNESHILSLKRSRVEGGHEKGKVLNIEIKDYLNKSTKFKSNYKGYKVEIEFEEKPLPIDPYFIGLWLGDGHSYSSRITTEDQEVVDYLASYATDLSLELSTYTQVYRCNSYSITKGSRGGQNFFSIQSVLRKIDLIENKHIPQNYLYNSVENRLKLLAGLIDSDGHYLKQSNGYEITQNRFELTLQIKYLCDSLGFRTSFKSKKASIASTGFESEVYRIRIYGNVDRIPVRIERKKANKWNSSIDWKVTGIQVEFDKEDDYYGFEIDGNHLFLLEDMTVTHNTAFVVSALRNAAVDFNHAVAIFSLEMSAVQLVNRMISAEAELESEKIRKGSLLPHEWTQLHHKINRLNTAPIFIDDTPALSILELRAKCRRLKQQHDIQLIVIDYLQLMQGDAGNGKTGNREQEIASISRALKNLAKELNVPVIALSQLSRSVETRGGEKKPQLSDLRESGSIEQDADMVMFLYRPEYYGITQDENGNPVQGIGEVIIAKNRSGSLETIQLRFIGKFTKFADLDGESFSGDSLQSFETAVDPVEGFEGDGKSMTFKSRMNGTGVTPANFNPSPPSTFGYSEPNADVPF